MQLPKQFKSWVQFYKYAASLDDGYGFSYEGKYLYLSEVSEMALKELLSAMPEEHIDMIKMYRNTMVLSPEEKLFDRLIDILY